MKKTVRGVLARAAVVAVVAASAPALLGAPAHAASSVTVDADGKGAVIDKTYSTTLKVSGKGFQSVKGGHGGIYVWFGTVNGNWKPSKGGKSGVNYVYVPDSEAKDNAGFQRYVAYPGSNTSAAANGGTMNSKGSWSTRLVVPGPKFEAVGRNGSTTVDCRKVTCGVITIGAHGVRNGNNETFTPVKLVDLYKGEAPTDAQPQGTGAGATSTPTSTGSATTAVPSSGTTPGTQAGGKKGKPAKAAPAALSVDHAAAVAGRAMSFSVSNLVPGEQFTVVLDDGAAAVGPYAAGTDGRASGVIQLPRDLAGGTHELRVFGASVEAAVSFGVQVADETITMADEKGPIAPANAFAGVAALLFIGAVILAFVRLRGGRRAQP